MMLALSILGGLLNRWRGGWDPIHIRLPHTVKRLIFSVAAAVWLSAWVGFDLIWTPAFAALLWVGFLPGWGQWWHVDTPNKFLLMSLRGALLTGLPSVAVYFLTGCDLTSALTLAVSGLNMAPLYWLGWKLPIRVRNFAQGPELGEVLFGSYLWLTLALLGYNL